MFEWEKCSMNIFQIFGLENSFYKEFWTIFTVTFHIIWWKDKFFSFFFFSNIFCEAWNNFTTILTSKATVLSLWVFLDRYDIYLRGKWRKCPKWTSPNSKHLAFSGLWSCDNLFSNFITVQLWLKCLIISNQWTKQMEFFLTDNLIMDWISIK